MTLALVAKVWLVLILLLDLFVVVWDALAGAGISRGFELPAVGIFAGLFHGACLLWFAMRRSIHVGMIMIGIAGAWCLFWMYLTQTRGALVGLVGSLLLMAGLYLWGGGSKKLKLIFAGMILLAVLTPALILLNRQATWIQSHPILLRYASLSRPMPPRRIVFWRGVPAHVHLATVRFLAGVWKTSGSDLIFISPLRSIVR